ncbi:21526_t:CDS:2, partial [Racocetra persica]
DWMYQGYFRDINMGINDKIKLGDTFGEHDLGYPVFISGESIEIAYHPDLTQVNNYINCCAKKYKEQNIIKIKEEKINEYLMLIIIKKARSSVPISISQKPILIPQPSVPILIPPNIIPEKSNDINDKNIFNSIKEEITDSIKTNNDIKDLIDDLILKQDDKNKLHNLRKQ